MGVLRTADLHRLDRAMTLHRSLDPEAEKLVSTVRSKLASLALDEVYGLMRAQSGPERSVSFTGRLSPDGYRVMMNKRERRWGRFGDVDSKISLKPVSGTKNYVLTTESRMHLGALRARHWFGFWRAGVDWTFKQCRETPPKAKSKLDDADHQALSLIQKGFPNTYAFFTRYVEIADVVAPFKSHPARLRLRYILREDKLTEDFPAYAKRLERTKKSEFRARLFTRARKPVAVLRAGGPGRLKLALDVDLSQGQIFDEGFTAEAAWRADILGLKVAATHLDFDIKVTKTQDSLRYCASFARPPKVTISGAVFDIVSTDVIDALLPDTLQENLNRVMTAFAKGNGGRGLQACTELPYTSDEWVSTTQVELLGDGLFAQLARLGAQFSSRDEALLRDRKLLRTRWLDAYKADMEAMQERLE